MYTRGVCESGTVQVGNRQGCMCSVRSPYPRFQAHAYSAGAVRIALHRRLRIYAYRTIGTVHIRSFEVDMDSRCHTPSPLVDRPTISLTRAHIQRVV